MLKLKKFESFPIGAIDVVTLIGTTLRISSKIVTIKDVLLIYKKNTESATITNVTGPMVGCDLLVQDNYGQLYTVDVFTEMHLFCHRR